jgi:hypothetical protein
MLDRATKFANSPRSSLLALIALSLPVLVAIWCVPWFISQDEPLHLYNAYIMLDLLKPGSALSAVYSVRWEAVPYWAEHSLLSGFMLVSSAPTAAHLMMSITSVGLAGLIIWLRWRVAGREGILLVAPLAIVLALSVVWLIGLHGFLLGACIFPVTLGVWWSWREYMGWRRALALAGLLVVGYLCHPVSLGLTVIGLGVLAVATPGHGWLRRCGWSCLSLLPLVPLGFIYRSLMQSSGEAHLLWDGLVNPASPRNWLDYLRRADFLLLRTTKSSLPFIESESGWFGLLTPSLWVGLALLLLVFSTLVCAGTLGSARRGWMALAFLLLIGGLLGPTSLGGLHGGIFRERVLLIGLMALVPALKIDPKQLRFWIAASALLLAAAVQIAFVWEYAFFSNRLVSDFMRVKPYVGSRERVLIVQTRVANRFRSQPLAAVGNMLGIDTDNLVWNNYGPSLYYFPIKFKDDSAGRRALMLATASRFDLVDQGGFELWERLLAQNRGEIDKLVVLGFDPRLDAINAKWFSPQPIFQADNARIFQAK